MLEGICIILHYCVQNVTNAAYLVNIEQKEGIQYCLNQIFVYYNVCEDQSVWMKTWKI